MPICRRSNAILLAALLFSGCSTHTFVVGEPVRSGSAEPASADSFGAVIERTEVVECPSNSMVEVRVKRDILNSFVSVITLGLYQRTNIEYVCGKQPDDDVPVLGGGESGNAGGDADGE